MQVIINTLIFSISILFIISSFTKLFDLKYFIDIVTGYNVLSKTIASIYGAVLPFFELSGAILLLFNKTVFYGIFIILIVLISFLFAVSRMISDEKKVTCGCYGKHLKADVDLFTLFKIYILLFFSFILLIMKDSIIISYSLLSILGGIFITLLLLLCQKVWGTHQETLRLIKMNKIN